MKAYCTYRRELLNLSTRDHRHLDHLLAQHVKCTTTAIICQFLSDAPVSDEQLKRDEEAREMFRNNAQEAKQDPDVAEKIRLLQMRYLLN